AVSHSLGSLIRSSSTSLLLTLLHPILMRPPGDTVDLREIRVHRGLHYAGLGSPPEGNDHSVLTRLFHRLLQYLSKGRGLVCLECLVAEIEEFRCFRDVAPTV